MHTLAWEPRVMEVGELPSLIGTVPLALKLSKPNPSFAARFAS